MAEYEQAHNANLAAEYFVASQLFRRGYIVTVTFGNTKQIDLVVIHPKHKKTVTIDVKGLKNTTNWPIPKNLLVKKDHFFVLVSFKNKIHDLTTMPEAFVIPARRIKRISVPWAGMPSQMCVPYSRTKLDRYKNNWDLLLERS